MAHPHHHALSSTRQFGGVITDYLPVHQWMDDTKAHLANFRHRAVRHHKDSLPLLHAQMGSYVRINSDGQPVAIQEVFLQHLREDCQGVPALSDWIEGIPESRFPVALRPINEWNPSFNWGGDEPDYASVKELLTRYHGLQLHHSQGIFQIEAILGLTLKNQEGRTIPIRTLTIVPP